jgi:hypothetical protein
MPQIFSQLFVPRGAILVSAILFCGSLAAAGERVEHVRLTGGQFLGGGFVEIWRKGVGWQAVCDRDKITWTQREGKI